MFLINNLSRIEFVRRKGFFGYLFNLRLTELLGIIARKIRISPYVAVGLQRDIEIFGQLVACIITSIFTILEEPFFFGEEV